MSATEVTYSLLPCPFCGGDAFTSKPTAKKHEQYREWTRFYPIVKCTKCSAGISGDDYDESCRTAINKWNLRNNQY